MQAIKPEILPEILILIGEIDEFKGGWRRWKVSRHPPVLKA